MVTIVAHRHELFWSGSIRRPGPKRWHQRRTPSALSILHGIDPAVVLCDQRMQRRGGPTDWVNGVVLFD